MTHIQLSDVFVRVDDLDPRELKRVAEVKRLISNIAGREGGHWVGGITVVLLTMFGCLLGAVAFGPPKLHTSFLFSSGLVMVVLFSVTVAFIHALFGNRNKADLCDLNFEVRMSMRSRQLLDVYLATHPSFGKFLPVELRKTATA